MKKKLNTRRFSKLADLVLSLVRLDVPVYAGNAAFFLVLSLFPAMILLLNLLSYTTVGADSLLELAERVLPSALIPAANRMLTNVYETSSGTMLSVTALAALWAASRGVHGILVGLNRVYGVTEDRGYVFTRFLSIIYTFMFLMVLVLTLVIHVFGKMILNRFDPMDNRLISLLWQIISNKALVLLVIQTFVFTAMFMFLPNRRNRLLPSLPGAVLASFGWQGFSGLYSLYVESSQSFSTIYGSLTSICIGMLWLYTCVAILFYGGSVNKYLADIGYELRMHRKGRRVPHDPDEDYEDWHDSTEYDRK